MPSSEMVIVILPVIVGVFGGRDLDEINDTYRSHRYDPIDRIMRFDLWRLDMDWFDDRSCIRIHCNDTDVAIDINNSDWVL